MYVISKDYYYSDFIKQGINTGLSVYWEETPLSKHLK